MECKKLLKISIACGIALSSIGLGSWVNDAPLSRPATVQAATNKVGQVVYKPGYGINLWNIKNGKLVFSGRRLSHGSRWKITGSKTINGHLFYSLGTNQYFDSSYIKVEQNAASSTNSLVESYIPETGRVGVVVYKPGYSINLWNIKNGKLTFSGRRLPDGTSWKITGNCLINHKLFYELGKNQYMQADYISAYVNSKTPKFVQLINEYNEVRYNKGLKPIKYDATFDQVNKKMNEVNSNYLEQHFEFPSNADSTNQLKKIYDLGYKYKNLYILNEYSLPNDKVKWLVDDRNYYGLLDPTLRIGSINSYETDSSSLIGWVLSR